MSSAFYTAGFEPWDVTVADLIKGAIDLTMFQGIVFVGGFSFADVLDSAKGWAAALQFRKRLDTFSLGVCNGCQLMALLGWIPIAGDQSILDPTEQPRFVQNKSGRFESRFSAVRIENSPAVMLEGMEGSTLGVWVAHGEGQSYFPDNSVYNNIISNNLAPIRYVNDDNEPTQAYPFNPNGSVGGIASICSADGRHLAMMPHPERCFLTWQQPCNFSLFVFFSFFFLFFFFFF
eukprot:GSMAST32.ASY1.ANO1.852.1 assembled CDS